jgi:hypothetical protein
VAYGHSPGYETPVGPNPVPFDNAVSIGRVIGPVPERGPYCIYDGRTKSSAEQAAPAVRTGGKLASGHAKIGVTPDVWSAEVPAAEITSAKARSAEMRGATTDVWRAEMTMMKLRTTTDVGATRTGSCLRRPGDRKGDAGYGDTRR